jgi:hypothetical protein
MHDISIILIFSLMQLNSSNPNNLFDDYKDLKDSTAVYSSIQWISLASQQEWSEVITLIDE